MSLESVPPASISLEEHAMYNWRDMFIQMYQLQKAGTLCDMTLRTASGDVSAHSLVLYTRIPYFRSMLQFASDRYKIEQADLTCYAKSTVESILQFVYIGKTLVDTLDDLFQVFSLADFLQIPNLTTFCEERIFEQFNVETCVSIANFAAKFATSIAPARQNRIKRFFLSSWNYILQTLPQWTDLEYSVFHSLIMSDEFNVKNEEQVLQSVLSWVSARSDTRADKLPGLLQDVRLHMIGEEVLRELEGNPLVTSSSPECRRLISEGRDFATAHVRCDTAIRLKPRNYFEKCVYFYCQYEAFPEAVRFPQPNFSIEEPPGADRRSIRQLMTKYSDLYTAAYQAEFNNCNILVYSKTHDRWEDHLDSVLAEDGNSGVTMSWAEDTPLVALGDSIYSIGNRQWKFDNIRPEDEHYDKVFSFDRLRQAFSARSRLPFPVMFNACCSLEREQRLFSCGGTRPDIGIFGPSDGHTNVSTALLSDDTVSLWESVSSMICERSNHCAVSHRNGQVFVVGGELSTSELDGCPHSEIWDAGTDRWTEMPNPSCNRTKFSACSANGRIMVFGGFSLDELHSDFTWEAYDPREGLWSCPQPIPRHKGAVTCLLDNDVFLIGGEKWNNATTCDVRTRDVHVMDIRMREWREGRSLPLRPDPALCDLDYILHFEMGAESYERVPRPTGAVTFG